MYSKCFSTAVINMDLRICTSALVVHPEDLPHPEELMQEQAEGLALPGSGGQADSHKCPRRVPFRCLDRDRGHY
jgi:hypothetical protein